MKKNCFLLLLALEVTDYVTSKVDCHFYSMSNEHIYTYILPFIQRLYAKVTKLMLL